MASNHHKWAHGGFTDTASYVVACRTKRQIGLDDGKGHQQVVPIDNSAQWGGALYRVGRWTVDTSRAGANCILKIRRRLPADDRLEINFEEEKIPAVNVTINGEERSYHEVTAVVIVPNQEVDVAAGTAASQSAPAPGPQPSPAPGPANTDPQKELAKKLAEAEEKQKAAEAQLAEVGERLTHAETELRKLRKDQTAKAELQRKLRAAEDRAAEAERLREAVASSRIDELLPLLENEKKTLTEERREKLNEAERLDWDIRQNRASIREIEERLTGLRPEHARVTGELKKLQGEAEDLEMDCEAAGREAETLKQRLGDDEDTAALMQEEPLLKDNSALRTLARVREELEAAEKRIGGVIRLREKLNDTIHKTIADSSGTGFIPLSAERGGEDDGVGSGPAEQDP